MHSRNIGACQAKCSRNPGGCHGGRSHRHPHHAGGLEHAATVIAELAEQIDPERLVTAARTAPVPWAQRLGYLPGVAGEADKAELLKRHVQEEARDITPLIPAMPREGAVRDAGWKLDINADVEIEA